MIHYKILGAYLVPYDRKELLHPLANCAVSPPWVARRLDEGYFFRLIYNRKEIDKGAFIDLALADCGMPITLPANLFFYHAKPQEAVASEAAIIKRRKR